MNYAKESEVKAGTVLIADGGFTCIPVGAELIVKEDAAGLYVDCGDGHHYLDGQLDDGDVYIGFTLKVSVHPDALCAGGIEIGVRACPKCGATEDDTCQFKAAA